MWLRIFAIILAFAISALASVAFAAAYAQHGGPHLEGLALLIALGALAVGVIVWALGAVPQEQVVDQRDDYPSDPDAGAQAAFEHGVGELGRHGLVL